MEPRMPRCWTSLPLPAAEGWREGEIRATSPRRVILVWHLFLALLLISICGCGDRSKPEAIWCETGTGPAEVVYPRAITYESAADTFFIIDRVAHVQRLARSSECLCEWQ